MTWGSVSQVLGVFKSRFSGGICWDLLVGCATPASILEMSSRNLLHIFSGMFMAKKDICWVLLEQAWAIDQSLVIPMRTPKEVQAACRLHFFWPPRRCPNRETAHAYLRPLNTPIDPPTTSLQPFLVPSVYDNALGGMHDVFLCLSGSRRGSVAFLGQILNGWLKM